MPTALVSFIKPSSQSVQPITYTAGEQPATFNSNVSPDGLQLQTRLNSTKIQVGGALMGQVSLFNTLGTNISLTPNFSANPNIITWDIHDSICGMSPMYHIFGYALFQGHYTAANISQATKPLILAPPAAFPCPNLLIGGEAYIHKIEFAPKSYLATVSPNASFNNLFPPRTVKMKVNITTGYCFTEPYQVEATVTENGIAALYTTTQLSFGCGPDTSLYGYWTMPTNSSCSFAFFPNSTRTTSNPGENYCNFHSFPVGSYTLVAEDLWNDTTYAYFQVASTSANLAACTAYYHIVLGQEYLRITNSTTYTSLTKTTSMTSLNSFTSTMSVSETAGYATTTTIFKPPSSWEVVTCIYPP